MNKLLSDIQCNSRLSGFSLMQLEKNSEILHFLIIYLIQVGISQKFQVKPIQYSKILTASYIQTVLSRNIRIRGGDLNLNFYISEMKLTS